MTKINSIRQFPHEIDRNDFGNWLSGFADGEACFSIVQYKSQGTFGAVFDVVLRADDAEILQLIQSFWNCGTIIARKAIKTSNPGCEYRVRRSADLKNVVVPHFNKHPLRAKKRADFAVWSQAVELLYVIGLRQRHFLGWRYGCIGTWKDEEVKQLIALKEELHRRKKYTVA